MTKDLGKVDYPTDINILSLKNLDTGDVLAVCTEIGKRPQSAASVRPRGLQHPPTTLPTCCPRYPAGSIVLECRLEGDQPVAHVVQVPAAPCSPTPKMCLLAEAKRSSSGPLSRVISGPREDYGTSKETRETLRNQSPMSYCLESRDCPGGAIAIATKTPIDEDSRCGRDLVTTMETTKSDRQSDGPSSRIIYGPVPEELVKKAPYRGQNSSRELPVTFIDCAATSEGPVARVTQCRRRDACSSENPPKSVHETRIGHDGGCPTATGFQCPREENSISASCLHDVLETRVDDEGPRSRMVNFPHDRGGVRYCSYMESKACADSGVARITQRLAGDDRVFEKNPDESTMAPRSSSNCEPNRASGQKYRETGPPSRVDCQSAGSRLERRNGLDPPCVATSQGERKGRRRVCPTSCCQPIQKSRLEETKPSESRETRVAAPRTPTFPDRNSSRDASRRSSSAKSKREIEKCLKSSENDGKGASRDAIARCESKDSVGQIESRELLARYREYISPGQIDRYEACRSKRNGLQDECILPVPRAVIELRRKERVCADDDDDDNNRRGMSDGCKSKQSKNVSCVDRVSTKPRVAGHTGFAPLTSKDDEGSVKELPGSICGKRVTSKKQSKPKLPPPDLKAKKSAAAARAKKVRMRRVRSRELYAGRVYIDCDCYHRNGLQHECPRTSCGTAHCKTKPWPECNLSTYFLEKWEKRYERLDQLPPTSFCGSDKTWWENVKKETEKAEKKRREKEELEDKKEAEEKRQKREEPENPKYVKCEGSVRKRENLSQCSSKPSALVKEYVMIPIKHDPKAN